MGINVRPNIVTNGLVLHLDALNTKSYPRSGTTWSDLSGNGNNGTLTNGPTFSNDNGGNIVFDGSNDYVAMSDRTYSTSTPITFNVIYKVLANSTNSAFAQPLIAWGVPRIYIRNTTNDVLLRTENAVSAYQVAYSLGTNNFNINNVCAIYTGWTGSNYILRIYNNGQYVTETTFTSLPTYDFKYYIGTSSQTGTLQGAFKGSVYSAQIYNRALSAQEVLQNYNALKSRFGLT